MTRPLSRGPATWGPVVRSALHWWGNHVCLLCQDTGRGDARGKSPDLKDRLRDLAAGLREAVDSRPGGSLKSLLWLDILCSLSCSATEVAVIVGDAMVEVALTVAVGISAVPCDSVTIMPIMRRWGREQLITCPRSFTQLERRNQVGTLVAWLPSPTSQQLCGVRPPRGVRFQCLQVLGAPAARVPCSSSALWVASCFSLCTRADAVCVVFDRPRLPDSAGPPHTPATSVSSACYWQLRVGVCF